MAELRILYHPEVVRRDIPSLDPPVRTAARPAPPPASIISGAI
jgi:hypothetical protein